jgi:hypothetical protein
MATKRVHTIDITPSFYEVLKLSLMVIEDSDDAEARKNAKDNLIQMATICETVRKAHKNNPTATIGELFSND